MDKSHPEYDPDTGDKHVAPNGMEHHKRRDKGRGRWYANVKVPHYIINLHQEAFPELAKKMKDNPDATNIYSAFLAIVPLEVKGKLNDEKRKQILESFNLV